MPLSFSTTVDQTYLKNLKTRSRKRPFPEDGFDTMTRATKTNHFPPAFLSLSPEDRRAMERTASLLNVPLTNLLGGPSQQPLGGLVGNHIDTRRVIDLGPGEDDGWYFHDTSPSSSAYFLFLAAPVPLPLYVSLSSLSLFDILLLSCHYVPYFLVH